MMTPAPVVLMRYCFAACLLFALGMASLPQPPSLPGQPSDKVQHVVAFAVLAILARLSFSRTRPSIIFVGLAAFGGLIELVQTIPALHRYASLLDWFADCAAVAVVLAVTNLGKWTTRMRSAERQN